MSQPFRSGVDLDAFVRQTPAEDLGEGGDVTSAATIPAEARLEAVMARRDDVTVAGLPLAAMLFRALDPEVPIQQPVEDGAHVADGKTLMSLFGHARAPPTAETSALTTIHTLNSHHPIPPPMYHPTPP